MAYPADRLNRLSVLSEAAVLVAAAGLRLYALALKPLHHDEGVNGLFLLKLFREGIYRYDAANYHGPTLYYFALITSSVNNLLFGGEGTTTIAIRLVPVFFGLGIIALTLELRDRLGEVGALFAAALLALSPGMVYFSRDFIHEIPLIFFTFWLVFCLVRYYETQQPRQLFFAALAMALMFATKETAIISVASIVASAAITKILIPRSDSPMSSQPAGWRRTVLLLAGAVGLFMICTILFFSSFFGNFSEGLHAAIATYSYWFQTGVTQHKAPWYTYLKWLLREESLILVWGTCGTVLALVHRRNRFALFAGLWGFSLLFAYSVLPYKTPWISMNALLPISLAGGYAAQQLWNAKPFASDNAGMRGVPAYLMAGTLLFTFYQSVQLNFRHYDDDRYVYPYVQTNRAFLDLIQQVDHIAEANQTGSSTSIAITTPEYWPLPWYLRNYKSTGYFGKPISTDAAIVIASVRQVQELTPLLADKYRLIGKYPMRPGVELVLYAANGTGK